MQFEYSGSLLPRTNAALGAISQISRFSIDCASAQTPKWLSGRAAEGCVNSFWFLFSHRDHEETSYANRLRLH